MTSQAVGPRRSAHPWSETSRTLTAPFGGGGPAYGEASPSSARRVLSRLTQTAEALTQVAAEG